MNAMIGGSYEYSKLKSLDHFPSIHSRTRISAMHKVPVMETESRGTRSVKVFPSFSTSSKGISNSSLKSTSHATELLVDITTLSSSDGDSEEDSVFLAKRRMPRLPRGINESGAGQRARAKNKNFEQNTTHLPAISDSSDSKSTRNSSRRGSNITQIEVRNGLDALPDTLQPRNKHYSHGKSRTKQHKMENENRINKVVKDSTDVLSPKINGNQVPREFFPNKQKLNQSSTKSETNLPPNIHQIDSIVKPSSAVRKMLKGEGKMKTLYKQSSFQLLPLEPAKKTSGTGTQNALRRNGESHRPANTAKSISKKIAKKQEFNRVEKQIPNIWTVNELRRSTTLGPTKRGEIKDSDYLAAKLVFGATLKNRSQSASVHQCHNKAETYVQSQGLKPYNSKVKIPTRPKTRPVHSGKVSEAKSNLTLSCPSLQSKQFITSQPVKKGDFWSMKEIAKYRKVMSVYLDSRWHQKRRDRFYQKLEKTQMQHWKEKRTSLIAKTQKMEESKERQAKQLRNIRHKHESRRSKRLNTQHVKWKYVLGGESDRAQYGLPSEYYTYYGFNPIRTQSVASPKQLEGTGKQENKTKLANSRTILFPESLDLNLLRKRNKQRYDNMFDIGKNRPAKVIDDMLKNGLFLVELPEETIIETKARNHEAGRKNCVRFQENPKPLHKKPSKLILVKNVVEEAEELVKSFDENYSEDFESDSD